MKRYLLDTNHLSAYLDRDADLEARVDAALRAGDRLGIVLPVLCEYRAGIAVGSRYQRNLVRLQAALQFFRLWPADDQTAAEFASLFRELRQSGRMLSQFDLLIAALDRQHGLTLLTADSDFSVVPALSIENWLQ
jgi:predicted nucleic acid-binding protein